MLLRSKSDHVPLSSRPFSGSSSHSVKSQSGLKALSTWSLMLPQPPASPLFSSPINLPSLLFHSIHKPPCLASSGPACSHPRAFALTVPWAWTALPQVTMSLSRSNIHSYKYSSSPIADCKLFKGKKTHFCNLNT